MGLAVLTLMLTNLVVILGWGEYFPWAIPGLYAQAGSSLIPASYWILLSTGLAGIAATCLWWKFTVRADSIATRARSEPTLLGRPVFTLARAPGSRRTLDALRDRA